MLFLFVVLFFQIVSAQQSRPIIKNYSPKEYNAFFQNWDIEQDKRGVMYFANNFGVLIYDGEEWQIQSLNNEAITRTIYMDSKGKMHIGGYNEFGYLTIDSIGKYNYVSETDQLPEEIKDYGNVWDIIELDGAFYYLADYYILKKDKKGKFSVINIEASNKFSLIDGKIHLSSLEHGVFKLENDSAKTIKNGSFFKGKNVFSLFKDGEEIVVTTRGDGVYKINNDTIYKLQNKLGQKIINNSLVYYSFKLPDNNYCFVTRKNGLVVTDSDLNVLEIINKESGLQNESCWFAKPDKQGNIWLALDKGISKVEYNTPFSYFGENAGIEGTVMDVITFNDRLYVATSIGVYVGENIATEYGSKLVFKLLSEIKSQCWDLELVNDVLLVASSYGLLRINKQNEVKQLHDGVTYSVKESATYSGLFYIGAEHNFSIANLNQGKFTKYELKSITAQVRSIHELNENEIWLGTYQSGAIRVRFEIDPNFKPNRIVVKSYSYEEGLLGREVDVFTYNNELVFSTDKGLMRHIEDGKNQITFYKDTVLGNVFINEERVIYRLKEDLKGNVWMYAANTTNENSLKNALGYAKQTKNKYIWSYQKFNSLPEGVCYAFHQENDKYLWIGGVEGLFRYSYKKNGGTYNSIFYTLINEVKTGKDSTIFYGNYIDNQNSFVAKNIKTLVLPYSSNNLQFTYSSTNFLNENRNQYQYYLEGFEDSWSDWTSDTKKQFTNLYEGEYVFHVRSKNIYEEFGIESNIRIKILPPWYRTIFAYVIYALILVLVIWLIVKASIYRLKVANIKLEKIVEERTKEIVEKGKQLQEAYVNITDSINYAKRLQEAMLPDENEVKEVFKETFVFYQPRDVVSGDFYWVAKKNNKKIFVVADCTGHGVPGAFVSMLGSNLLNQIILEKSITNPTEILSLLNNGVRAVFKKESKQSNTNDGMDISVCVINNTTVEYAGAQRPLYIVRDGELTEVKGDKTPIGGRTEENYIFNTQKMSIEKNDMLYMSSDGYADQFGGPKGKKFLTKNLKKLLVLNSNQPLSNQVDELGTQFNSWKGNEEQLDDVLIVGIKI